MPLRLWSVWQGAADLVFDRGIVSEENLAAIRKRGGRYLVGTPRSQMKQFEADLLNKANWTQVRPEVEVKQVAYPPGRRNLHAVPHGRPAGERESDSEPLLLEHGARARGAWRGQSLPDRLKDRNNMERRLGKIQARHPQVNDLYDVGSARNRRRRAPVLAHASKIVKPGARRGKALICSVAISKAETAEAVVGEVHAVDRSRGFIPGAEERALHSASVSSEGAARQGSCHGRVPRLRALRHAETDAETPILQSFRNPRGAASVIRGRFHQ